MHGVFSAVVTGHCLAFFFTKHPNKQSCRERLLFLEHLTKGFTSNETPDIPVTEICRGSLQRWICKLGRTRETEIVDGRGELPTLPLRFHEGFEILDNERAESGDVVLVGDGEDIDVERQVLVENIIDHIIVRKIVEVPNGGPNGFDIIVVAQIDLAARRDFEIACEGFVEVFAVGGEDALVGVDLLVVELDFHVRETAVEVEIVVACLDLFPRRAGHDDNGCVAGSQRECDGARFGCRWEEMEVDGGLNAKCTLAGNLQERVLYLS